MRPPSSLFAIQWKDRLEPSFGGILWLGGATAPAVPFTSREEAEEVAARLQVRQTTEIIEWKLVKQR